MLYETEDGKINVDVILNDETICLSQRSMADLFDKDVKTINRHLINIYQEELDKNWTCQKFWQLGLEHEIAFACANTRKGYY